MDNAAGLPVAFFVSNIQKHGISFCEYGMIKVQKKLNFIKKKVGVGK